MEGEKCGANGAFNEYRIPVRIDIFLYYTCKKKCAKTKRRRQQLVQELSFHESALPASRSLLLHVTEMIMLQYDEKANSIMPVLLCSMIERYIFHGPLHH